MSDYYAVHAAKGEQGIEEAQADWAALSKDDLKFYYTKKKLAISSISKFCAWRDKGGSDWLRYRRISDIRIFINIYGDWLKYQERRRKERKGIVNMNIIIKRLDDQEILYTSWQNQWVIELSNHGMWRHWMSCLSKKDMYEEIAANFAYKVLADGERLANCYQNAHSRRFDPRDPEDVYAEGDAAYVRYLNKNRKGYDEDGDPVDNEGW